MMRPEELRLLANEWRNIAGVAQQRVEFMRDAGIGGLAVYMADVAVLHAHGCAEQLEERAAELEERAAQ